MVWAVKVGYPDNKVYLDLLRFKIKNNREEPIVDYMKPHGFYWYGYPDIEEYGTDVNLYGSWWRWGN